jgi:hypothetical protein
MTLVFVDCEAPFGKGAPSVADMTEFGAVVDPQHTFHGTDCSLATFAAFRGWLRNVEAPTFISDNPAYDWQWISFYFWKYFGENPFGFSARRIGDFYAGLVGDFSKANDWKRLRVTKHTHMPVDDAMGNYEAFQRMLAGER